MEENIKAPIVINVPVLAIILTSLMLYGMKDGVLLLLCLYVFIGALQTFQREATAGKWLKGFAIGVTCLVAVALTVKMLVGFYSSLIGA